MSSVRLENISKNFGNIGALSKLNLEINDGEIFAFISYGGRQGFAAWERGRASASPMPAFQYLLTEQEKWDLVNFIRTKYKE